MDAVAGLYMLVVAMMPQPNLERDMYFFYQPMFKELNHCIIYANQFPHVYMSKIEEVYPGQQVEQVMCISVEKMRDLMKMMDSKEEGEKIST